MARIAEGHPLLRAPARRWPLGRYGTPPRDSVDEKLFFERFDGEITPR